MSVSAPLRRAVRKLIGACSSRCSPSPLSSACSSSTSSPPPSSCCSSRLLSLARAAPSSAMWVGHVRMLCPGCWQYPHTCSLAVSSAAAAAAAAVAAAAATVAAAACCAWISLAVVSSAMWVGHVRMLCPGCWQYPHTYSPLAVRSAAAVAAAACCACVRVLWPGSPQMLHTCCRLCCCCCCWMGCTAEFLCRHVRAFWPSPPHTLHAAFAVGAESRSKPCINMHQHARKCTWCTWYTHRAVSVNHHNHTNAPGRAGTASATHPWYFKHLI